jgi:predicted secreted hydrolase
MTTEPNWLGNLDPTDDAWHPFPSSSFSEWWYFDARFQQGYSLSVAWQVQGDAGRPPEPSIRGTLFAPDAAPRHLVYKGTPDDFQAAEDTCDVRMGESWLRGAPPRYEMHVVLEDLVADLTLTSLTPAWKHWDWHIGDRAGRSFFAWTVVVPMGRVEGTLRLGDREVSVTGRGYRDKCWMAGSIFRYFDRWYTGRLHSDDVAIVYYVIPGRRGGVDFLNACAVFVDGRLAYEVRPETAGSIQFVLVPDEERRDPIARRAYPIQQTLEPPENEVIGLITMETDQVAGRRILPPANLNWLSRQIARLTIRRATIKYLGTWQAELLGGKQPRPISGEAISEIVYLR